MIPEWPLDSKLASHYLDIVLKGRRWWSREGTFVSGFERQFAEFTGVSYAHCCASGTAALEIGMKSLGIGVGDVVIVPSYTFIGTAMAVLRVGALPVFSDVDLRTGCLDLDSLEAVQQAYAARIKAVVVVHLGGLVGDLDAILQWARSKNLAVVEDCAQAIGTTYGGRHVGGFGDIGCFSFQNGKNLSSGEGGCVVTDDRTLAIKIGKYLDYNHDVYGDDLSFSLLSGNQRLSEFQGAVLNAQFADFKALNGRRTERFRLLRRLLAEIDDGIVPLEPSAGTTAEGCHLFMFRCREGDGRAGFRDALLRSLQDQQIPCWAGYDHLPLHSFQYFKDRVYRHNDPLWSRLPEALTGDLSASLDCPAAETLARESIWIPQFVFLREEAEIRRIATAIGAFVQTACGIPAT